MRPRWKRGDPRYGPKSILDCPLGRRQRCLMTILVDRAEHDTGELLAAMGIPDPGVGVSNRRNAVATVLRDLRERWGCGFETRTFGRVTYVRWDGLWSATIVASGEPAPSLPLFELD